MNCWSPSRQRSRLWVKGKSLGGHAGKNKALSIYLRQKEKTPLGTRNLYSTISHRNKEINPKISFKIICESPFVLWLRSAEEHKLISLGFCIDDCFIVELVLSSLNVYLFDITVNDLQHQYEVSSKLLLVLVPKIEKLIQFEAEWIKQTTNMFVTYVSLLALLPHFMVSATPPPS